MSADKGSTWTWEEARALRDKLERAGKRLVFTNGCFDILHAGHVRYLKEARALGDALCVAINADASVRALKGEGRPVHGAEDRAEVLGALRSVDAVIVFEDERATGAIEAVAPHIYAKGGDYTPASLDASERGALERAGADIRILQLVPGRSTTRALDRLASSRSRERVCRLGVLGSGRGSTLEGLLAALDDGRLHGAEVAVVISDVADAYILEIARSRGIPAVHIDPGPYRNRLGDRAQGDVRDCLRAASVDLVILAGFMRRLKTPILEAFPERILNVHPSLLPKYPGRAAWEQALSGGETETGATVHLVDEGIDSGRILGQARVPVEPGDTAATLQARIQVAERALYPRIIGEYALETLNAMKGAAP